jgi:hypothetical protein
VLLVIDLVEKILLLGQHIHADHQDTLGLGDPCSFLGGCFFNAWPFSSSSKPACSRWFTTPSAERLTGTVGDVLLQNVPQQVPATADGKADGNDELAAEAAVVRPTRSRWLAAVEAAHHLTAATMKPNIAILVRLRISGDQ